MAKGHPRRIRESMGMACHVFQSLVKEMRRAGLRDGCYVKAEEKVSIFM